MINRKKKSDQSDIVILGAGCAGLSLAYRLLLSGYSGSVLILERNRDLKREQRWCSWGPIEPKILPFVSKTWTQFSAIAPDRKFLLSAPDSYYQVYAPDYLEGIKYELSSATNFELRLNSSVRDVSKRTSGEPYEVETDKGSVFGRLVFDGRNLIGEDDRARIKSPWLWQSFAGQIVNASREIFNSDTVTLMDFDVPGGQNGAFIYVLPYSERSALIESTLVANYIAPAEEHLQRLTWYIQNKMRVPVKVKSIEKGVIPMTAGSFPFERSDGIYAIGSQSGAAKPSTGYAFSRIQRQTQRITDDILKHGKPLADKPDLDQRRRLWLDDVFITAASTNEQFFTQTALKMFDKLPADLLIRFLSESDTVPDSVKVMSAIGNLALASAAAAVSSRR